MLQPLLLAQEYWVREYSKIYSLSSLLMTIGVGAGPTVLGVLHDVSGYRLAFFIAALASALAFTLFVMAGPLTAHEARAKGDKQHRDASQNVGGVAPAVGCGGQWGASVRHRCVELRGVRAKLSLPLRAGGT